MGEKKIDVHAAQHTKYVAPERSSEIVKAKMHELEEEMARLQEEEAHDEYEAPERSSNFVHEKMQILKKKGVRAARPTAAEEDEAPALAKQTVVQKARSSGLRGALPGFIWTI